MPAARWVKVGAAVQFEGSSEHGTSGTESHAGRRAPPAADRTLRAAACLEGYLGGHRGDIVQSDLAAVTSRIGGEGLACHHDSMMTWAVYSWWALLSSVALFNLAMWLRCAQALKRLAVSMSFDTQRARRLQLMLSAIYVLGCAYRSFFPVFDVPRLCLVDSVWASVAVGRTVATLAELSFVAQWALLLHEAARATGSRTGTATAWMLVPLIVVAETCSWYSVLTTANIGHVIEESLWGLGVALLVASLITMLPRCPQRVRALLGAWCLVGLGYVLYMYMVDVPLYWSRWVADSAAHRPYLSVLRGFTDVASHWTVSHDWRIWRGEVVWMTLYFSLAVWISLSLIQTPELKKHLHAEQRRRDGFARAPALAKL